jgi:hypothetical protein
MAKYEEGATHTSKDGKEWVVKSGKWVEADVAGAGALAGAGEVSGTPEFQQSFKLPQMPGPTAGGEIDTGITPEFLTDMLPAALGTLGGVAGTVMAPGVGTAILGGLGSGAGEALRQEVREGQGFAPATGVMQEYLDLDPTGTAAKMSGVGSEAIAGLLAEFAALRGAAKVPEVREKALRRFVSSIEDPKASLKTIEGTTDALRPVARDLPVGMRGGIARKAERRMGPAGDEVERIYTEAGDKPSTYKVATKRLRDKSDDLIETPETTIIEETSRAGRSIATGEPQEVITQIEKKINEEKVRDKALKDAYDARAADLSGREKARALRGKALDERENISVLETWKQRKQAGIDSRRAASEVFSPGADPKKFVPRAQAGMEEYGGLRDTLNVLVPEGKRADDIFHAWSTMLDKANDAERNHFLARWAAMGVTPGPPAAGRLLGIAASAPAAGKTLLSKYGMMMADALEAGNATRARQIFRGFIDASMQPDTEPMENSE